MDSDSGDILIKFVYEGNPIEGSSQTDLVMPGRKPSMLAKDFKLGYYFEIDNFTLRCGTSGLEPGAQPPPPMHNNHWATSGNDDEEGKKQQSIGAMARKGGYQAWRNGNMGVKYPLDIQPITFERPADTTSRQLMQACIDCASFDSATIIKRKPIGGTSSGEIYLRIDFTSVLIVKVDWADEDDYVKETIAFISRAITMSYRPELQNGVLGPVISGFWGAPDEQQVRFN